MMNITNKNSNHNEDLTDSEMPGLMTDSSDQDWNDAVNSDKEDELNNSEYNVNVEIVKNDNNIQFKSRCPKQTIKATRITELPSNLDSRFTAGAVNNNENQYTNGAIQDGNVIQINNIFDKEVKIIIITGNQDETIPCILWSNAIYSVEKDRCILLSQNEREYDEDELEDIYFSKTRIIRNKTSQWYIHVPIRHEDGTTVKTWIFADPGANTPCVKTEWAIKHFRIL